MRNVGGPLHLKNAEVQGNGKAGRQGVKSAQTAFRGGGRVYDQLDMVKSNLSGGFQKSTTRHGTLAESVCILSQLLEDLSDDFKGDN